MQVLLGCCARCCKDACKGRTRTRADAGEMHAMHAMHAGMLCGLLKGLCSEKGSRAWLV